MAARKRAKLRAARAKVKRATRRERKREVEEVLPREPEAEEPEDATPRRRGPKFDKPPPRQSLAHRGGRVIEKGDRELSGLLSDALREAETAPGDELTHGFHTHPARMHPAIASVLVPALSSPDSIVLDPFCGSGTVLVEALVHGRRACGVDLDPMALRIAEQQCALRDGASRARFASALRAVAGASEERVRTRAEVAVHLSREERAFYDPHVMLELCGLFAEIEQIDPSEDRRALELVFSSMLVKFSRQRSDTSEELVKKRIRKGLVTEFFARKGRELVLRWAALAESVPRNAEPARLLLGDARRLPDLLGPRMQTSFVLSSPPYGGTYDYARHHARRHAFLSLDAAKLTANELGARRTHSSRRATPSHWDAEMHAVLESIAQVLAPRGRIVFFVGDAEVAGMRVEADQQLARLAPKAGLRMVASAAQPRPDFRGGQPRSEHLVLMERG